MAGSMTPVAILLLVAGLSHAQDFQPYKFERPDMTQYLTSFDDTHSKQARSGEAALASEQSRTHLPSEAAEAAQLQHRTRRVRKEQVPAPTTNATQAAARKGVRRKSSQTDTPDAVQSKWSSLMNAASSNHQRSTELWPADELAGDEYDADYSYAGGLPEDEEVESARSKAKPESVSTGRSAGAATPAVATPAKRRSSVPAAEKKSGGARYKPKKGHADESYDDAYYDDDYYYDSVEGRREGGGYGASSSSYGGGGGGGVSPLALLVAPLAGIALLTAAAAVALNPVLVNISLANGRKKRDARKMDPEVEEKIEEMKVLEDFLGKVPRNDSYQQKVLSMYLTCSGFTEDANLCLERVVCEYAHPKSSLAKEERDVISIVLYHIMGNPYVENEYKDRLKVAARLGKNPDVTCKVKFPCSRLDTSHF